jgi:septum formation protein
LSDGPRLVLASASPRRADVLRQLRLPFTIDPARLDESYLPGETPGAHVERLALEKARAVAPAHPGALVVGGDTVVVHQGRVLGKPADPEEARAMLSSLAGRSHDVLSGLALVGGRVERSTVARARVTFRAADERALEAYVATGESMDKAGAYGIQEAGAALVEEIRGDYYTVVGFPVAAFLDLLAQAGIRYTFTGLEPLDDP